MGQHFLLMVVTWLRDFLANLYVFRSMIMLVIGSNAKLQCILPVPHSLGCKSKELVCDVKFKFYVTFL